MRFNIIVFCVISFFIFTGSSPWEGSAAIAPEGELPVSGFFIATNSFPRNTVVDITNIETNRSTRVIVANTLDASGLLAIVSREAADLLGMRRGSISRIRMTQPSDPIAYLRFSEGMALGIPSFSSGNVITEENLNENIQLVPQGSSSESNQSGETSRVSVLTLPAGQGSEERHRTDTAVRPYVLEPEWGGGNTRFIIDFPADIANNINLENHDFEDLTEEHEAIQHVTHHPLEEHEAAGHIIHHLDEHEATEHITQHYLEEYEIVEHTAQHHFDEYEIIEQITLHPLEEHEAAEIALHPLDDHPLDDHPLDEHPEDEYPLDEYLLYGHEDTEQLAEHFYSEPEEDYLALLEFNIVPAEVRPPEDTIYEIDPSKIIPEIISTTAANTEDTESRIHVIDPAMIIPGISQTIAEPTPGIEVVLAGIPSSRITESLIRDELQFSIPRIYELNRGSYYVQIAAFDSVESVESAAGQIDLNYKPMVYKDGDHWYRILLGPMNQGESAAVLQRFRSIGYRDAFVRHAR